MHLVFLDNRKEVAAAVSSLKTSAHVKLIAMTAEAAQYLEELRTPYEPVSAYADTTIIDSTVYDLFNIESYRLAQDIENYVAQHYMDARFENPAFLSGLSYYLQYSVNIILLQSFLMREVIQACKPEVVTVFNSGMDPWFSDNGYEHVPWFDVIGSMSNQAGFMLNIVPLPDSDIKGNEGMKNQWQKDNHLASRIKSLLRRNSLVKSMLIKRELNLSQSLRELHEIDGLHGLRLLMVQSYGHNWKPILSALQPLKRNECFFIEGKRIGNHPWAYYYESTVHNLLQWRVHRLKIDPPVVDKHERYLLSEIFNRWIETNSRRLEFNVMGMDLLPALVNHLKTMLLFGPALARHADSVAIKVLENIKPNVVCFIGMINMADQRLAYYCRKKSIPVVCYQHGGGFGVIHCAKDEQSESAHADFFLTHGRCVQPRKTPAFPVHAKYVPVGSSRIESMAAKSINCLEKREGLINLLWIGETSTRNRISIPFTLEDTERYLIQKKGLEILAAAKNIIVTFRPVAATLAFEGTIQWLNRQKMPTIKVDIQTPLSDLIHKSDVVINSTASPTTWEEVIGLKKPMVLYARTPLDCYADCFVHDLKKSCCWCRDEKNFYAVLQRLIIEGTNFILELKKKDPTNFIQNYVLYKDDGQCIQRVASFLQTICQQHRQPVTHEKDGLA